MNNDVLLSDEFDKRNNYFMADNIIFDKIHIVNENGIERRMNCHEIIVICYLYRCTNNKKSAFPSYNKIAESCGMSKSTAIRTIDVLVNSGFISKKRRGKTHENGVKNYSNVYTLRIEKLYKK